jgi:hypothetical protein
VLENDGVGVGDVLADAEVEADAVGLEVSAGEVAAALLPPDELLLQPATATAAKTSNAVRALMPTDPKR